MRGSVKVVRVHLVAYTSLEGRRPQCQCSFVEHLTDVTLSALKCSCAAFFDTANRTRRSEGEEQRQHSRLRYAFLAFTH